MPSRVRRDDVASDSKEQGPLEARSQRGGFDQHTSEKPVVALSDFNRKDDFLKNVWKGDRYAI